MPKKVESKPQPMEEPDQSEDGSDDSSAAGDTDDLEPCDHLFWAAHDGCVGKLRGLLSADPSLITAVDDEKKSALLIAATHRQYAAVSFLLGFGADVSLKSVSGQNVLHCLYLCNAVGSELEQLVPAVLARGLDINANAKLNWTALHLACASGDRESVDLLLQHGANARATNSVGDTPLHVASLCDNSHVVDALLAHDGGVDAVSNHEHRTPAEIRSSRHAKIPDFPTHDYSLDGTVEDRAREHPDSFYLPPQADRCNVLVGGMVKLIFLLLDEDGNVLGERMFVTVQQVLTVNESDKVYSGMLMNQSVLDPATLFHGRQIWFQPKHIIDIWTKDESTQMMGERRNWCQPRAALVEQAEPFFDSLASQ